jgi:murein L,D-transpeptidase YcbB/YkuD
VYKLANTNTSVHEACGFIYVGVNLFLTILLLPGHIQASPPVPDISNQVRLQIEKEKAVSASQDSQPLHAGRLAYYFYAGRSFSPAWLAKDGLLSNAVQLIHAIEKADEEGLDPADYHLGLIHSLLAEVNQNTLWQDAGSPVLARLDITFTDAFLTYAAHLAYGRFNPKTIYKNWQMPGDHIDLISLLNQAVESGQTELALINQLPKHRIYSQLRENLARYKAIANRGGWPEIDSDEKLKAGDRGPLVLQLRSRLFITGELSEFNDQDVFDKELTLAVIKFQASHGLSIDGTVGHKTLTALNVPVEERIHQIKLNMERWRWLPQQLGNHYILVNITDFSLSIIENGYTTFSMPVIVGKTSRNTPSFSAKMTYIVVNPFWRVPRSIAIKDKLPLIRKDPDYLSKHNFRVFQWFNGRAVEIDPNSISWNKVTAKNFNYSLRQDPGPDNALGSLKFMFPNKFSIYLHDTPSRNLFAHKIRTFSSGCIRVASPIDFANHLLKGDPVWDSQTILSSIDNGLNEIVSLPEPIPVYVLYWTAWVGEDGGMQFRDDIYRRDSLLTSADSVTDITDLIASSSSNKPPN